MTRDNEHAYMELVRASWLTCRGPQRAFAQAWLKRYDLEQRQARRRLIKHRVLLIVIMLITLALQ